MIDISSTDIGLVTNEPTLSDDYEVEVLKWCESKGYVGPDSAEDVRAYIYSKDEDQRTIVRIMEIIYVVEMAREWVNENLPLGFEMQYVDGGYAIVQTGGN
jgi:hypothetical protein